MTEKNRFQDVDEYTPNWSPRKSGTKETGYTSLDPTDESWVIGYYLGSRDMKSKTNDDTYVIHKIKVLECGNHDHLGAPLEEGGTIYEFFGTGVVNNNLQEKVQPGQCVQIKWLGLQQPKTEKGRAYQGWFVGIDTQTDPITVQNGVVVNTPASSDKELAESKPEEAKQEPAQNVASTAPVEEGGDDDLPF